MNKFIKLNLLVLILSSVFFLNSSISLAAFHKGIDAGTYRGRADAGDNTNIPCSVKVENGSFYLQKITINSARLTDPLVWKNFKSLGSDYQRNDFIDGFIEITRNDKGDLTALSMQYETSPSPIFNTSTVSEICIELRKE